MTGKEILKSFKKSYPKLMRLKPKLEIYKVEESGTSNMEGVIRFDNPIPKINVFHPFIFDNRLVPKKFNGIEVNNITIGPLPKEFPREDRFHPWNEYNSIEHYVNFVDNNLSLIRKKLKVKELSRNEALEAITGGVNRLIQDNIKNVQMTVHYERENMVFFHEMLYEISQAYYLSDIYKFCEKKWYYSLTSTRIVKNKPLIIGLNHQIEPQLLSLNKYPEPQSEYPFGNFDSSYEELGTLRHTIKYFYKYNPKGIWATQSNLCFFRSESGYKVSKRDIELCRPIFLKLIDYINPPYLISFTKKFPKSVMHNIKAESKKIGNIKVYKGYFEINKKKIGFYVLPHPDDNISKKVRKKAWEFCFGKPG